MSAAVLSEANSESSLELDNVMSLSIHGFAHLLVSIGDQKYGYDLSTEDTFLGEGVSEFITKNDFSIIEINNIFEGAFTVNITGEVEHEILVDIEGIINGNYFSLDETIYFHGDQLLIDFYLNSDGQLQTVNLPEQQKKISSKPYGNSEKLAKITWSAVSGAQKYRIYTKTDKDPRYMFEKEFDSSTTFYETQDLWDGKSKYYRITTVDNNGNESLLTHQVPNKTINFIKKIPNLSPIFLLLLDNSEQPEFIYSENFSSDPKYKKHISSNVADNCFLDWNEGSYYAQVTDHADPWYCVSESPKFKEIAVDDRFRIEFDFNPVTPDRGNYPGIYFVDSTSEFPNERSDYALFFKMHWSDAIPQKFMLRGNGGQYFLSEKIPAFNEWYHIVIVKDSTTGNLRLKINREDGSVFVDESEIEIGTGTFNQIFIGEVQGSDKYGDFAEIRLDNIKIK
jgi:hypothetical protein